MYTITSFKLTYNMLMAQNCKLYIYCAEYKAFKIIELSKHDLF